MRCAVGIAFKGDAGHGDARAFGKPLFQISIFRFAFGQAEPPPIIVNHDVDMVRIVESGCAAIERGVIKVPLRRSDLPDQLGKIVPVVLVAGAAAFGGKIILIPPLQLGLGRQRLLAGFLAADQVAAHRNHRLATLRPERREDVGRPCAPVITGDGRFLDLERIHQGDDVERQRRRLAVAKRFL